MIDSGSPAPLGATTDATGTNFAVYSSVAERIELCLFDPEGRQTGSFDLPGCDNGIWHGYVSGCRPGQRYGYRTHGPYAPEQGLRCNPRKLLLDPYARALDGIFDWNEAVLDNNDLDSASFVPKGIVYPDSPLIAPKRPQTPWSEMIFYEANVRGYTMRHPALDEVERGTFDGMRHKTIVDYIKALGVTSLELMPVHEFLDERHLVDKGLRNFWGYNTLSFFVPSRRYAKSDPIREFRDMVRAYHDANIEVILDVVYNHTAEGDGSGPSLSFRGLDNLAYYSTEPGSPDAYINDTGCGNTLNADHPQVQQLVLDSLHYWHKDMGVDGFRFDLAPVLGRHNHGYSVTHPMLEAIEADTALRGAKLIAEPWDPGPGGYQLGNFPQRWAEWNDRYRDDVRQFWRGDSHTGGDVAKRLHGSAKRFESGNKQPHTSVNFISSHDGFTMADLVSYEERHNEANGENNQDGHSHNLSCNYGIEGPTDNPLVLGQRRRHRLNLFATLLFSQGTPLLLAGDEFGHSQQGNNNAYAQDNDIGWLDWSRLEDDPQFAEQIRKLIKLRRNAPLLRLQEYIHGRLETERGAIEIRWLGPDGQTMSDNDWSESHAFCAVLSETDVAGDMSAAAILVNGSNTTVTFSLPTISSAGSWQLAFSSSVESSASDQVATLPEFTISLLLTHLVRQ